MMNRLNKLAHKESMSFDVLKDLFEFMDLRKDNCVDLNEFLQVFKFPDHPSREPSKEINRRVWTGRNEAGSTRLRLT